MDSGHSPGEVCLYRPQSYRPLHAYSYSPPSVPPSFYHFPPWPGCPLLFTAESSTPRMYTADMLVSRKFILNVSRHTLHKRSLDLFLSGIVLWTQSILLAFCPVLQATCAASDRVLPSSQVHPVSAPRLSPCLSMVFFLPYSLPLGTLWQSTQTHTSPEALPKPIWNVAFQPPSLLDLIYDQVLIKICLCVKNVSISSGLAYGLDAEP